MSASSSRERSMNFLAILLVCQWIGRESKLSDTGRGSRVFTTVTALNSPKSNVWSSRRSCMANGHVGWTRSAGASLENLLSQKNPALRGRTPRRRAPRAEARPRGRPRPRASRRRACRPEAASAAGRAPTRRQRRRVRPSRGPPRDHRDSHCSLPSVAGDVAPTYARVAGDRSAGGRRQARA